MFAGTAGVGISRGYRALACGAAGAICLSILLAPWSARAACTPANPAPGQVVTCTGAANPLAPSYASSANDLTVNVQSGAGIGVLLGLGGTALQLGGNNVTLNNAGNIDPSLLGLISLLSSGTSIGSSTATQVTVNNLATGRMYGTGALANVSLADFTGLALLATTASNGTVNINNAGLIGGQPLVGVNLLGSDVPAIAVSGGGRVSMVNTGTINGRVAFQSSAAGNTFVNAGAIDGSVSLGANSTNTFTAVTGSSFTGSGGALELLGPGGLLYFAPTGVVDGGRNGNNTLALQNPGNAGATGTGTLETNRYINFNRLRLGSGTWTLNGTGTFGTGELKGGALLTGNAGLFTTQIIGNGGALEATTAGLSFAPSSGIVLNAGGLGVQGANGLTLASTVSGAGGLTKNGTGVLALTGTNTYAGGTTLNAGTLAPGNNAALGTGTVTVNGGSLRSSTTLTLGNAFALNAALTLPGAAALTLTGPVNGAGSLVKNGAADLTLAGANGYTGGTTLNAGRLVLGNGGALGTGALNASGGQLDTSAALTVGNAINLTGPLGVAASGNALTLGGTINGTGSLAKLGAGTLALTGNNGYSGGTSLAAGVLQVGSNTALGTGALAVTGNATLANSAAVALANAINVGAGATLQVAPTTPLALQGAISGAGALGKTGSGELQLSGNNSYGGGTALDAGRLVVGSDTALGTGALNAAAGTVLDSSAAVALANAITLAGPVTVGGSNALTLNGTVAGAGSLDKQGAAALTLGAANTYLGGTRLSAGTLVLGNDAALGSGALTAAGGTTLDTTAARTLANAVNLEGSLRVAGSQDLALDGVVAGTGGLLKDGAATLALNNANAFDGGVDLAGGTLALGNAAALGTGTLTARAGTHLQTSTALTLGNTLDLLGPLSVDNSAALTLAGTIGGTGTLVKAGAGDLQLTGSNTYSGGTQLDTGTLLVGTDAALGTGAITAAEGTTLSATAPVALGNAVHLDGTLQVRADQAMTLGGVIDGSGGLLKTGAQALTLSGDSSFAGGVQLQAGSLLVGSDTALGTGTLVAADATVLDATAARTLQNAVQLDGALTLPGTADLTLQGVVSGAGSLVKQGGTTLTLAGANDFAGRVELDAGRLVVGDGLALGSGTLTVAGAATLDATQAVALGNSVQLNAGLNVQGSQDLALTGPVNGTGSLFKDGAAALTLSGDNGYSGGTTLNAGSLLLGSDTALGTGALVVSGAAALDATQAVAIGNAVQLNAGLDVRGTQDLTLDGVVDGTGALVKDGAATLVLNGDNTYAGGTLLNAGSLQLGSDTALGSGTLQVQGDGRLATQAALAVDNAIALGAALTIDNSDTLTLGGVISGSGDLVKTGTGDLLLQANNTFAGNLDIQVGEVIAATPTALGQPQNVNIAAGAGLTLAGGGSLAGLSGEGTLGVGAGADLQVGANDASSIFGGQLSGAGNLEKIGNGVFQLAGSGNLGGATTVSAGVFDVAGTLATSALNVASGATLRGAGTINAPVTIADGAHLGLASGTTLGTGNLTLSSGSIIDAGLGTPNVGLLAVNGNLTLDGTLNITDIGGFGNGVYRLVDYTGALTNNGLLFGTIPGNVTLPQLALQTAIGQQINLVVTAPGSVVQFWDGAQTIGNGAIEGGAGAWDAGTHWTGADGLVNAGWANDFAIFNGASAGVVTVVGTQATRGIQFALDGYQLVAGADGQLRLDAPVTPLRVDGGSTAVLDVPLVGAGALQKLDPGTLVLNGVNSYAGGTQLDGGTLVLGNAQAISAGTLSAAEGTTLDAGTALTLANTLDLAGALSIGGTNDLTLSGPVGGGGSLVKNGAATLTLGGANTYAGGTQLNAGTLRIDTPQALGTGALAATGGTLDNSVAMTLGNAVTLDGTLSLSGNNDLTLSGVVDGPGALVKNGAATLALAGANSYAGGTTLGGGTLWVGNDAALGTGTLGVTAAATLVDAGAASITNAIDLGAALTVDTADDLQLAGTLGGDGGLGKSGSGTLTLSGSNTLGGTLDVQAGRLQLASPAALGNVAQANVASGATLGVSGGALDVLSGSGAVDLAAGSTLQLGRNDADGSFAGSLGGAGGLEKIGGGTLGLTGSSAIAGATQVSGGTLAVDGTLATSGVNVGNGATLAGAGSVDAPVTIGAGGHLAVRSGQTLATGSLAMDAGASLDAALGVPSDTRVLAVNGDLALDGTLNITDLGGFGDGVYRLIDYSGALSDNGLALGTLPVAVQPGQLVVQTAVGQQINLVVSATGTQVQFWDGTQVQGDGVIQGGAGTWDAGTHWTDATGIDNSAWNGGFAVFGGEAGGVVSVVGTQAVNGMQFTRDDYQLVAGADGQLQLTGAPTAVRVDPGVTATLGLPLVGEGSLDKRDTGTLVLDAANSYTGGTLLSGGTLVLGDAQALGTGALTAADATTLDTGAAMTLANDITLDGALTLAGSHDLTLAGVVAGEGGLVKQGGTTLTLDAANTYGGGTALQAGTLVVGNAQALGSGTLVAADGTTLDSTLPVQLGNDIALEGTLTLAGSHDLTLAGDIAGSGGLVKNGGTTLTLGGTNSYGGGTTVNAGTLVGNSASLQGGITDNGAVVFDQGADGTFNGNISGSGSVTKQGDGALRLAGANSYGGGTTINAGTLIGDTASLQGNISDNAALVFDQGTDGTYAGSISGSGGVTKQGDGALRLAGANSYGGGTTVAAGTLIGDTASLQGDITDNAALVFDQGADGTYAGSISGSGTLTKQGAGTLALSGANSYGGGTTISDGTLLGNTTSLQGDITDNAALVFDQGSDGAYTGAISGTGAVTKQGAGALTLAGANSYSGGTTVAAGTLIGDAGSLQGNIVDNAALVFDQAGNGTYTGTLSGTGSLGKTGDGTLVIAANNAGFTGTTTVSAGTLGVGDAAHPGAALGGPVVVASGGTLTGNGSIGSLDLSGTLASGGDGGSLSVVGNTTVRGGSTWQVTPTSSGTVVPVSIGGTLQIDPGATLQLGHSDTLPVGTPISIATAAGGVTGSFGQVNDDYAFLDPSVAASAAGLSVTLERDGTTVPSQAQTPNQAAAGGAIETLPAANPVYNAVIHLPDSPTQVTQALSALSGESHANTAVSLLDNRFLFDGIGQRLRGQATSSEVGDNTAWVSARALPGRIDPDGGMPGLRTRDEGVMAGIDRRFGERVVAGIAVGRQDMESWSREYADTADIDANHIGVYAQAQWDRFSLSGGLDYADYDIQSRRQVSIGSTLDERLHADYDGQALTGYVEAAWTFEAGTARYTPYLNLAHTRLKTDGFTEQGGNAALAVDSDRDDYTTGTLGVRAAWDLGQRARLEAGLGWQHAFGDTELSRTQRFAAAGGSFAVRSVALAKDAAVGELGLSVQTSPASRLSMMLQGASGDGETAYGAQLSWGWRF